MGIGLSALLGLAGGADAVGGGLSQFAAQKRTDDQRRQQTALQALLAGYSFTPDGQQAQAQQTPTAQGHPLAQGMYAHGLPGAPQDLNDLLSSLPNSPVEQPGAAISQLVMPRGGYIPGMGTFQELPQNTARRSLDIQKEQGDIAHTKAETAALENNPRQPITGSPAWQDAERFKAGLQQPRNIDPLSPEGIAATTKRAKAVFDATRGGMQTPDQVKMHTVEQLATPAADQLLAYYDKHQKVGMQQAVGGAASHIPLIGNAVEGFLDKDQQAADDAAVTLATQYLEAMPKSRFQPSTVHDILKQVQFSPGDQPEKRKQKRARVLQLQRAIQARASNPTDLPDASLDDAPIPP